MKKYSSGLFPLALFFTFLFSLLACRKINESTELGYDLIPPIDNVTTFDTSLAVTTDNKLLTDTTTVDYIDHLGIGTITNDPEFGSTVADGYFKLVPILQNVYPFLDKHPDSVQIDSVVLHLSYNGAFGDTIAPQRFTVFEIANNAGFYDSVFYRYNHPDFQVNPTALGQTTFSFKDLDDSVRIQRPGQDGKVANVLRIHLNNSFGVKLHSDTTAYKSDTAFKRFIHGLAVKADAGMGNGIGYFNAGDTKTRLIVYYKGKVDGKDSSSKTEFVHAYSVRDSVNGQANLIKRTPSGNYASYLANGNPNDDRLYIQSAPGSVGLVKIPVLDALPNSIVHRAELIIYRIPSSMDNVFTPPSRLFLDMINNAGDTAYVFEKDLYNSSRQLQYEIFGGLPDRNNVYKFNITRHVQGIIAKKEKNLTLRLYAPLRTELYFPSDTATIKTSFIYQILGQPANGRIVVAGGNFADPSVRMRLRIIYSKL